MRSSAAPRVLPCASIRKDNVPPPPSASCLRRFSAPITKQEGMGGRVPVDTVKEQLLYELGDSKNHIRNVLPIHLAVAARTLRAPFDNMSGNCSSRQPCPIRPASSQSDESWSRAIARYRCIGLQSRMLLPVEMPRAKRCTEDAIANSFNGSPVSIFFIACPAARNSSSRPKRRRRSPRPLCAMGRRAAPRERRQWDSHRLHSRSP